MDLHVTENSFNPSCRASYCLLMLLLGAEPAQNLVDVGSWTYGLLPIMRPRGGEHPSPTLFRPVRCRSLWL